MTRWSTFITVNHAGNWHTGHTTGSQLEVLESFSIDDGDGSEKVNSLFSDFVAFIPINWKCEMWASFPGVDFLRAGLKFKKRKENSSSLVTFSITREIRHFHVVVVKWRQRNVQKSVIHVQTGCFANQIYCFERLEQATLLIALASVNHAWRKGLVVSNADYDLLFSHLIILTS